MAQILDGKTVAASLRKDMQKDAEFCKDKGITPKLAILRVGENRADLAYEKGVKTNAHKCGVELAVKVLPENVTLTEMLEAIDALNKDASIHGILMFRPLPKHLDEDACCAAIVPEKDIDAVNPATLVNVFIDKENSFVPCTAQACMEILRYYKINPAGKRVVVLGRSTVIGKPVAALLCKANATVTLCHSKTKDVSSITKEADIVIVAIGKTSSIGAQYFTANQSVIDVGIGFDAKKKKLCGDVDFDSAEPVVGNITPVPGGVGIVTTTVLLKHVIESAKKAV